MRIFDENGNELALAQVVYQYILETAEIFGVEPTWCAVTAIKNRKGAVNLFMSEIDEYGELHQIVQESVDPIKK